MWSEPRERGLNTKEVFGAGELLGSRGRDIFQGIGNT
jgi:hypothetical protein